MTRTAAGETTVSTPAGKAATGPGEAVLLQRLRDGQDEAFGELYELHVGAVRRLARSLSANRSEADDLTAETFFRVLQAMRRGSGPRESARAYLLTVARRVFWEWQDARREVPIPDDELTFRAGGTHDRPGAVTEHALITRAFASLPERWRVVLWQTEVEGVQPAVVGPHFGLSANATAALARRARLGLRAAYLQAHIATEQSSEHCRAVLDKLGGYTAGSVTGAQARKVRAHLRWCPTCRATHGHLRDVCSALRAHAGALAVLVPATGFVVAGASGATGSATGTVMAAAFGTKLKVGLAVASTTAAGALMATPVVIEPEPDRHIGLPGPGAVLGITPSTHPSTRPSGQPAAGQSLPDSRADRQLPAHTGGVIALSPGVHPEAGILSTSAPSASSGTTGDIEQRSSGQPQPSSAPERVPSGEPSARQGRIDLPGTAGETTNAATLSASSSTARVTSQSSTQSSAQSSTQSSMTPTSAPPSATPSRPETTPRSSTEPTATPPERSRPPETGGTTTRPTTSATRSSTQLSRGEW